jgi:hypothetical protein
MNPSIYYIFGVIYFLIGISQKIFEVFLAKKTEIQYPSDGLLKIDKLDQYVPNNKPPIILSILLVSCSILILAFGIWTVWGWFAGFVTFKLDFTSLFILIVFLALPSYTIIDTLFIEPKNFRLGRSLTAQETNIQFQLDKTTAFEKCIKALSTIDANVRKLEKPKYIIALSKKSKITITFRSINKTKSRVHIICDSQWLTVKWDGGANRKCLDQLIKSL